MKKLLALLIAVVMILSLVACTNTKSTTEEEKETGEDTTPVEETDATDGETEEDDPTVKGEGVMTHEEYLAAEIGSEVVIEAYVQDKQSWWNDKACLYLQDADGAYYAYNASCSEEDYNKLEKGTKVKVTGQKAEWSGEIELGEGATFEIENGKYIAEVFDATELLGNDEELIKHQNEYVTFKGLTVAAKTDIDGNECAFFYGYDNSGEEGSDADLYFDAVLNDQTYTFSVEYYLRNEETDVYKAVQNLKVGDKIDIEGFLYWYDTQSTQVTALNVVTE